MTKNYTVDPVKGYTQDKSGRLTDQDGNPIVQNQIVSASPNPNSEGVNDVSDSSIASIPINLPMRAEKRFFPTTVNMELLNLAFGNNVKDSDFYTYANSGARRLQKNVDFMKVRIPHRGLNPSTHYRDPNEAIVFRFLTNPSMLTVNRQTVDSQSLTRGGWQFGVWGEDTFMVNIQGTSAGAYFSKGTTDEFSYYAVSYRNLMQLQQVFENNGYFFEGEEYDEGPLAADYLRRRIRMHQDVELWVGNFIWFGMFDSLTLSQNAENPFLMSFNLNFFVWKERYRSTSPYWGSIENNVQRGHTYEAVEGACGTIKSNNLLARYSPSGVNTQALQIDNRLKTSTNIPYSNNPAVNSATADDLLQTTSPTVATQIGYLPAIQVTSPNTPDNSKFWRG